MATSDLTGERQRRAEDAPETEDQAVVSEAELARVSQGRRAARKFMRNRVALVGAVFLVIITALIHLQRGIGNGTFG